MTQAKPICPSCDKGELTDTTFSDTFTHRDGTVVAHNLEGSVCSNCDSTLISMPQYDRNRVKIKAAKRRYDRPPSGAEISRKPVAAGVGVGK